MLVLAIETSCDETSCAVVENGRLIISNVISSQAKLFEKYGGVVPEIASRKHVELIIPVIEEALLRAGKKLSDIDAVAVTKGPGLVGALLTGISVAKGIAVAIDAPLIGVNHLEGHIASNYLSHPDLKPPFICLLVSGGHTHILEVIDYTNIRIMGRSRDDAAGEAFDKVARAIGFGYPGGPKLDQAAKEGNPDAYELPVTRFKDNPYDFSFSGLKTAVLNILNNQKQKGEKINIADISASFQMTVAKTLVRNTMDAMEAEGIKQLAVAGGVAANSGLRREISAACDQRGFKSYFPPMILCTDNAAMIGAAAFYRLTNGESDDLSLDAQPSLRIGNPQKSVEKK